MSDFGTSNVATGLARVVHVQVWWNVHVGGMGLLMAIVGIGLGFRVCGHKSINH